MLEPATLRFLKGLSKNNNRPWFEAHRAAYEAARIDFQNFIQLVMDHLQKEDATITGLSARDCLFRINRDIRFSKNKAPYKTNFGASIKREGKKSVYAGYYFHLEPGKSFIGGGLWMPEAPTLKKVRQEVDYCWEEFQSIINEKEFKNIYSDLYKGDDVKLSTVPKGYEKENPAIDYLKLKSLIAEAGVPDVELTKPTLHQRTITAFKALQPLLYFFNRALATES
ncbi:MAG: DUF2461 domain-containing protein [Bacteroidota bacterium]|nr:DUF2461 domain-containing protein [Bacteroidota bacterium]